VGYRVSDETGKCEALQKAWLHNQTIESGYGYAKKVITSMKFMEPLVVSINANKTNFKIVYD
jgi:hypothetical protein